MSIPYMHSIWQNQNRFDRLGIEKFFENFLITQ
jgi:hypothetical protein